MKYIVLLIMTSFLSTFFGVGQTKAPGKSNDVYPKDSFCVVQTTLDDNPVIGSFNREYKNYKGKVNYPWCLTISIALDPANLYEYGLPKDNESAIANKLEDELVTEIEKLTTAHYIGHLYNDTFLDIYVYLDDPEKVQQYLQTQINKEDLIRGFKYEINKDPKWTTIAGFMN